MENQPKDYSRADFDGVQENVSGSLQKLKTNEKFDEKLQDLYKLKKALELKLRANPRSIAPAVEAKLDALTNAVGYLGLSAVTNVITGLALLQVGGEVVIGGYTLIIVGLMAFAFMLRNAKNQARLRMEIHLARWNR